MKGNQLKQVWYVTLLVIAFISIIFFTPDFSIFGYQFKKLNLLADIQIEEPLPLAKDSIIKKKDSVVVVAPPAKPGKAFIEEFGSDNLRYFFEALRNSKTKPVRVAFFGDSFIEGDILCGPFRDTLQGIFGGSGVGYMPITSEVTKFRTSIQHDFIQWNTFSMVGKKNEIAPLGLPGYCFLPAKGNEVVYKPAAKNFISAKIFYESDKLSGLTFSINELPGEHAELELSERLNQYRIPGSGFNSVKISFHDTDSLRVYGMALEDSIGVSVDNFAMRSNPGMGLLLVDAERMKQFDSLRNYKLVVLQYGLNVISENDSSGYLWYLDRMVGLIKRMKENFGNCGFLLLSVGDRCSNQNGRMATMPDVKVMRDIQRRIAQKSGIAYWDMFVAMGGENSIKKYTESQPPLAAKDYTHLTFRGGRKIAKKLADALLNEKVKYDRKR
jgi:flavodoxin